MQVYPVESDQLFHSGLDRESSTGPALVMTGITVPVSNCNSNTGYRTGRPAPECEGILAGMAVYPVRGTGPAGSESPAKARVTGTEELSRVCHASLRINPCWT